MLTNTKVCNIHCVSKKSAAELRQHDCQILTAFHNFWTTGRRRKFATAFILQYTQHTLGMLLHYLGKLKIHLFETVYFYNAQDFFDAQHRP